MFAFHKSYGLVRITEEVYEEVSYGEHLQYTLVTATNGRQYAVEPDELQPTMGKFALA